MEAFLILSLVSMCMAFDKASFYGASYISYPLQEAKGVSDMSFKFRTHLSDALLLLAAGKTDYCMIRLEAGRLKLHINLGAGESELSSTKGIYLNDSQWHHVSIVRREANLTMKVDENAVKKKLPGRFFELNIHFGIFLGGQGDFSELFLGHMENFRGCMEDVYYNGVKIIEKARSRSGSVRVEGVTWNCAQEFDADINTDISFIEEGAYIILPKINSRAGGRWQIEFKTIMHNAMILYNPGGGRGSDFLAVEILGGVVRVKMARGQILHSVRVNDGQWHKMHLLFNPSLIELSVDNIAMSTRIESGGTRYLDLSDSFYLGGIESEKRQRAFAKGVKAADSSIMGCIKPVEVDEKMFGLPNAGVTYGVSPKCAWWYPCHQAPGNPPCVPSAVCEQHGVDHFTCKCDSDLCINPDYAEKYKVFSKSSIDLELVSLYPLSVQEGGVSVITTQNIDVILDHHKYGVRPSGVLLHVAQSPLHGRIAVDLSLQRTSPQYKNYEGGDGKSKQYFTLMDLSRDKVRYVHDGSENHQDAVVLDMELIPETKFTLPSYLQGRNTFVLHVNVTPVNDPPVLNLLTGKVLRLTQGTRKVITSDILKAEDPDTPPEDLLYTIIYGKNEAKSGHIEMSGQPVDSFTQQDVDAGVICYVHGASADKQLNKTSLRLTLQVSDGIETSGPGVLRISIVPLQLRLVNNTGLQLVHNSFGIISADNLTFATNSDESNVEVKYEIVKPPQFGVVERLRVLDGTWQTVDSFTSEMVTFGRVRYMHLLGAPTHDEFKFKASVGSVRTNTLYDFRLTFIKLELYQTINEELVLNNTREAFISSQHLNFNTKPLALPSDRVLYTIIRPPKYGILHLSAGKHHLQAHSTFTQHNIDTNQLWYRLHRRAYSHIQDEFLFVVGATECENITGVMTIRHVPSPTVMEHATGRVHTTLERLQVTEGSRMVIPSTHLNFRTEAVTNLVFNITHLPKHGKIEVANENQKISRDNTTYFTLQELNSDRVYYAHDDSESRHDSFHFMALSLEPEDFQYVGVFHIDIILKNDNSPVRANDNVFHIVHGGSRLITSRDLSYTDADLDTKPSDIIYTVQRFSKEPPNGAIYRADNPSEQIAQFTQDDLNKNLVLFRHQGKEYGKMAFWISDGLFDVNGNLEIQASPPFIKMYPTNGSIVENGKAVVITSRDMQVDTNMNCLEEDIRYQVTVEPKHGSIEVGDGLGASSYSQLDVAAGRVAYRHREPKAPTDGFRFKVTCLETYGEGEYPIRIFPSSYWEPLRVSTNRPLVVEESTSVNVTREVLEVMHPQIEPSNIVYKVTEGPFYGWLEISNAPGTVELENYEEPVHTKVFDQSIINSNRLTYVQAGVNRTRDNIKMDVTNGIVWLRDVELTVLIIPEHYYMSASNLTVVEGGSVSIKPDLFRTVTEYYRGKVVLYKVIEKPKYGKIAMGEQEVNMLPVLKLNSGNIRYTHDGSEETRDSIKLVAVTESNRESEPFTLWVTIAPVNDETPIVAANTGLCVWEGGTFTFTRNELYVSDVDTPLENVSISVVDIVSGYVALRGDLRVRVSTFTQADIDNGLVIFVHESGSKGKMIFNVTDGLHELSKITFLITTKPVFLKLVRNQNLRVFPLMREPLNNYLLMSRCSDPSRTVVYKIERAPARGRIVILSADNHHRSVKQFTQQDVNDTLVYYEHTHPFSDLYTNDSFIFNVEAAWAKPIVDQIFHIDISVSSGGLAKYVYIPQINVPEGGKIPLKVNVTNVIAYLETQADLRQPKLEAQWSQPTHGELQPSVSSLTQAQLEDGVINYQHDDSDTLEDKIEMSLFLLPEYVLLCNVTIPIQIVPVNDQPFRLLTDAPQIQVVQGENYTITRNDLLTEDADTGPDGILYDIITGPTLGRMILLDKNHTVEKSQSINKFTQADINSGRVIYEHSGMLQTATFYFRVWDGEYKPTYTVFTIDVIPVILNATSMLPIYLQQGSNVATVSTEQIYVDTNAKKSKVWYNITRQPLHGMIYVGRSPVTYFSHRDLTEKVVIYMQNDMTTANDSFDLIAYVHNGNSTNKFKIDVIVQPLMALSDLRVEGDKAKITLNIMDATGLAKLTASDPIYTIIRKPRYGYVKKIIRSSGEKTSAREREVAYFSHEDVKAGVIYFVMKKTPKELNGIEDNFRFLLAASIFQPAAGEMKIFIGNRLKKNLPGPNDPEGHEGVPVSGDPASYYMMILMALSGTILAIVVIFGLLKCKQFLFKDQNALVKIHGQNQGSVAPIPLPRPPDHLMPSPSQGTPPIKRYLSSEQSMHTGASSPLPSAGAGSVACKVTPLAPDAARYPYGEDHTDVSAEDWSSYEASESAYGSRAGAPPPNPMLRRNQYWV